MRKVLAGLVVAIFATAFVVFFVMLDGLALKLLWNWFAVPQFGVAPFSLAMAIGIACLIGVLRGKRRNESEKTEKQRNQEVIFAVSIPIAAIVIGWIAHHFI
jgi:hypothetical protein